VGPLDLFGTPYREPAACVVRVDGDPIGELHRYLTQVTVECSRAEASVATLVFDSRRDEHGRYAVQDERVFAPWAPIVIEAAFGDLTEEVFRGYVREVRASYPETSGASTFEVRCQDESLALDREHVRLTWGASAPTTDAQILQAIAGQHALAVDPASGAGLSGLVLHQDDTDVRFLRARAEANGYELIFREGTVYFGPMRLDATPQETIRVHAGAATNCLRLDVRSDGHRPDRVAVDLAPTSGSEPRRREFSPRLALLGAEPAARAGDGLPDFRWVLSRQGAAGEDELAARAQAKADELSMRVVADGELDGSLYGHVLQVGMPVPVDGVGEWMSGVYYVDQVTHAFGTDGYRQRIRLLRNALGDNLDAGPAGVLDGIR
jgi:hypothetical protein